MNSNLKLRFNPENWKLQCLEEPFTLFKLSNVLADEVSIIELKNVLSDLEFTHKVTDIFSLNSTKDLLGSGLGQKSHLILEFLQFLDYLKVFLSHQFNIQLEDKFSISCSAYVNQDYLLCHDDKTEDRSIAFIYYLNRTWNREWGGSLDLFDHDEYGQPSKVIHRFYPEFNSLIFFKVGNYTYHQVAEVLTDQTPRITLNGWFHSKEALKLKHLKYIEPSLSHVETHSEGASLYLNHFINNEFTQLKYMEIIVESLQENGIMMLQNFFRPKIYEKIASELTLKNILWRNKGPANRRKYKIADEKSLPLFIKSLLLFVRSQIFCSYVEELSSKKLFVKKKGKDHFSGTVFAEIQSWKNGDYSLIVDDDSYFKSSSVDIFLFFNVEKDSECDGSESQSGNVFYYEKFQTSLKSEIEPQDNSICLVLKNKNETKYVSYISEKSLIKYNVLFISFKI